MAKFKLIDGMDYSDKTAKDFHRKYTKEEFQKLMRDAVKAGGHRRAEKGDTFIHDKNWNILYEIWAVIPE